MALFEVRIISVLLLSFMKVSKMLIDTIVLSTLMFQLTQLCVRQEVPTVHISGYASW